MHQVAGGVGELIGVAEHALNRLPGILIQRLAGRVDGREFGHRRLGVPQHPPEQRPAPLQLVQLAQQLCPLQVLEDLVLDLVQPVLYPLQRCFIGVHRRVHHAEQQPHRPGLAPLCLGRNPLRPRHRIVTEAGEPRLVLAMYGDEAAVAGEDRDLSRQRLDRRAIWRGLLVIGAHDDKRDVTHALVLGEVIRLEAVGHEGGKQSVLCGGRLQFFRRWLDHVDPPERRLGDLEHRGGAHRRPSRRCAAAAAPKPLSMFTTVTPAAQELSMPSRAASP